MSNISTISCEDAIAFVCEASWGFAEVSPAGKFLWVNPAYCAILNAPADLIIGTNFEQWTHEEDKNIDLDLARKVAIGELPGYTLAKRYIQRGSTPQNPRIIWGMLSVNGKWHQQQTGEFAGYRVQFRPYTRDGTGMDPAKMLARVDWEKVVRWTTENWKLIALLAGLLTTLIWGSSDKLLNVLKEVQSVQKQVDGHVPDSSSGLSSPQPTP